MRTIIDPDCPDCQGRGEIYDTQYCGDDCYLVGMTCHCVRYEHSARDLEILHGILD